ncbi:cellulose-binding protein [Biscogniauxia mediterranea]|nr:cellulose-binding protein [Biscogniauxia mediterranea]
MKCQSIITTACLVGTAFAQAKLKIMPLGDSITEITCWRAKLWDLLKANGVTDNIEFVGSQTNNPQNCQASDANWDKHHEGHSGFLAINIANTLLEGWLASAQPDVVMFMLGTNDVAQGRSLTDIMAAYTRMVDLMRASNPNMKIIVDSVIPLPMNNAPIEALNAAIPPWAAEHNTTESPVYFNDVYPYPSTALRDGVHPNDAGDVIIADALDPLLTWVIRSSTAAAGNETSS